MEAMIIIAAPIPRSLVSDLPVENPRRDPVEPRLTLGIRELYDAGDGIHRVLAANPPEAQCAFYMTTCTEPVRMPRIHCRDVHIDRAIRFDSCGVAVDSDLVVAVVK